MKILNTLKFAILTLTTICSFFSWALDFDKEITKQEVTSMKLQQDLLGKSKNLKGDDKDLKKQDLQVVLIPKSQPN